jgi:hypothetical protein
MSLRNSEKFVDSVRPFPPGKNVRIKIEGLAVCYFNSNPANSSEVDFLQFVRHHPLRLTIIKIAPNGTITNIKRNHPIPPATRSVNIVGSNSVQPTSFLHDPTGTGTGEFPLLGRLGRVLHLSKLHGVRFSRRINLPEITTLTLRHVSFCTNEVTLCPYIVKLNYSQVFGPIELCRVIGGYMECPTGTVTINNVNGVDPIQIEQNHTYEITLANHCVGNPSECEDVIGVGGRDVRFLYQILNPDATPIELEMQRCSKPRRSSDVAACLPGVVEPFPPPE